MVALNLLILIYWVIGRTARTPPWYVAVDIARLAMMLALVLLLARLAGAWLTGWAPVALFIRAALLLVFTFGFFSFSAGLTIFAYDLLKAR